MKANSYGQTLLHTIDVIYREMLDTFELELESFDEFVDQFKEKFSLTAEEFMPE